MRVDSSEAVSPEQKERIRRAVLAHGFDRVGFAAAGVAAGAERFRLWLERGRAGTMSYLARTAERRVDPRSVLEGARTVIVAALHYAHPAANAPCGDEDPRGPRGTISAYARGDDYHRVLARRLEAAAADLAAAFGGSWRYYVDTGPVLEKDWAQTAGVGWIGKNACSIDTERGSYFFLGVLLATMAVEPDPPAVDRCGSCQLCLEACPTGALVAPGELDARLCISYLTIESRDETPTDLAARSGSLVFGCDICQEVCPYNRRADPEGDPALAPRAENVAPSLEDLARLDAASFRGRFARSPVLRAKLRGFLRNVIVALSNCRTPRASEALLGLSERDDVARDPLLAATLRAAWKGFRDT
jgi:epoxyqueuosine reductase